MSNRFAGKLVTKNAKFLGEEITINKLTVAQVLEIQEKARNLKEGDEQGNIDLVVMTIKSGCKELVEFETEVFMDWPLEELQKLSGEILKFSGLQK